MSALPVTTDDIDFGIFGPGSTTWRVHTEPILWVAGLRALYLQSLHPKVMRGTAQNSSLMDPKKAWNRFLRTAEFVGVRTFGTTEEVDRIGRRVRGLHSRLTGHDPDTDSQFRIDEPDLLLWVHCGEIDSYVNVARRAGIVDDEDADRYVAESVRAAEVVGIRASDAPSSRAELAAYFERMRPQLYACPEARRGLVNSLNPPVPGKLAALKILAPPLVTLSFATLPRWARRMFGAPGLPTTDLTATVAVRALRETTRLLPEPPTPPTLARARELQLS